MRRVFTIALLGYVWLELASFVSYFTSATAPALFWGTVAIIAWLSWRSLPLGVLIALGELVTGSKGHLLASGPFSLRLAIFLTVFASWVRHHVWSAWKRKPQLGWHLLLPENLPLGFWWYGYLLVVGFAMLAGLIGLAGGRSVSAVFMDGNGYLYLGLLPAVVAVWEQAQGLLLRVWGAGLTILFAKTAALAFLFSHHWTIALALYKWARDTGFGEITFVNPAFYRVFSQSQVFAPVLLVLFAWAFALWRNFKSPESLSDDRSLLPSPPLEKGGVLGLPALLVMAAATALFSLSRSFWLALGVSAVVLAAIIMRTCKSAITIRFLGIITLSLIAGWGVVQAVTRVGNPYAVPRAPGLEERFELAGEAAASSRISQLQPLWKAIQQHWLVGSGFGRAVSYQSQDPRVLQVAKSGWYTTYAFEWGYLDWWLKGGLLGLAALLSWVVYLAWRLLKAGEYGWLGALLVVTLANMTTPYLNHPLGLGVVMVAAAAVGYRNSFRVMGMN